VDLEDLEDLEDLADLEDLEDGRQWAGRRQPDV